MSKKPVLIPKAERREAALKIAVRLAKKIGAARVSIAMVAAQQKVTPPLLFHIFENREQFTKAVLKAAKAAGVVLPAPAPTEQERRAAAKKVAPVKKLAALLKPKPKKAVPSIAQGLVKAGVISRPLTPAQKKVKAERDRARRECKPTAAPTTPAGKFAALPKPFEAAIAQV